MENMKIGERLLTATVDHLADTDPTKICFSIPLTPSPTVCVDISYERFANSIDRLAWWLEQNVGLSDNYETICYLGPPDLSYFIFALAACKCGYKVCDLSVNMHRLDIASLIRAHRPCSHHLEIASKPMSTFSI